MPKASSTDLVRRFLLVSVLVSCQGGCGKKPVETIRMGEWIALMISEAGIIQSSTDVPYYLNVPPSSVYFEDIQTAVDWNILSPDTPVDPQSSLTREWAACTLMNLAGIKNENDNIRIRDISRTRFPEEVRSAVISGLMELDRKDRFLPDRAVDAEDGKQLLARVLEHMDRKSFDEERYSVEWQDDEVPPYLEYEGYDTGSGEMVFTPGTALKEGQLFYTDKDDPKLWKAENIREDEEGTHVDPVPEDPLSHICDLKMEGSFEADFSTAEITDLRTGEVIQEAFSYTENTSLKLMAAREKRKVRQVNGFEISYETSRDGISVQAVRSSPGGLSVYAELGLNGLSIDYKWDMEGSKIKDAYLRFSFTAAERLGAKRESNWQRQINPAAVTKENFIQAVRTAIREGHDEQELSIPICRIRFPIPNAPGASANCQLNLDLSADGRAEISLGQTAEFGMEMRGGSVRPISRFTNHPKAMIEASTSILSEIAFSLQAAGITLSDILIHAGLGSTVSSTVHQYDKNGSHTSTVTELPADLVNEMASGSEGILVCSDITANWISDIDLNSSESAAGRLGLSLHIPLLSGMKANVYPKTHMENFHFVDRCTRSDRQMAKPYQELPESEQIRLSAYSMILDAGETAEIQITRLPAGYSMSSIRLSSQDPSVASVSGMKVTAVSEGSTVIRAATSDGRYSILCSVSVRQEKSHAGSYH